ncbi:unnamed protein product [Dicrocoelium dendriticum]|nr:unnamed protein product [Dicrocoelium dendriticum]
MSLIKTCTQCKLVVYPLEQLKCLDQIWHRKCFRCQTCGMTLTMGNYRGYDKKPYCSAHYPQPKRFTVVPDTPELQRVAQNTRVLSTVSNSRRLYQSSVLNQRNSPPLSDGHFKTHSATFSNGHGSSTKHVDRWSSSDFSPIREQLDGTGHSHSSCNSRDNTDRIVHRTDVRYSLVDESPTGSSLTPSESIASSKSQLGSYPSGQNYRFSSESGVVTTATCPTMKADPVMQTYRAMYDYEAREDDEVTFIEGDIILDGDPITDGWMYGTVQRTGQFGMLPSNYVEPI